jgi:hypothetical protein
LNHAPSRAAALAERAFLWALGGTCHSALAVLTRMDGDQMLLKAALFSRWRRARGRRGTLAPDDHAAAHALAAAFWPVRPPASARFTIRPYDVAAHLLRPQPGNAATAMRPPRWVWT